jgi:hypothetical protein
MAFIAFRSFQHLLTVDEQRATLTGFAAICARTRGWPCTCSILVSICWPTKTRRASGSPASIPRRSAAMPGKSCAPGATI